MAIYKLKDVCTYMEGYVNPPINEKKYFGGNIISWMKVADFNHCGYVKTTTMSLSEEGYKLIKNKKQIFKKGSIVWSKSGSVGLTSILDIDVTANRGVLNIIPKEKILLKYLFYFLCINKSIFEKQSTGAVLKHFYGPNLLNTTIDLPEKKLQQKIIDIIEPFEVLCSSILKQKNCLLNIIKNQKTSEKTVFLKDIVTEKKDKPLNIGQVSAKVLHKRDTFIYNLEKPNTYKTNSFYAERGSLLFCSIRTYLNKFAILPYEADVNGTLYSFKVVSNHTSIICNLLDDKFWELCQQFSKGTKMPVMAKQDLLNKIPLKLVIREITNIWEYLIILNKLIIKAIKIKDKLMKLIIK
ncbi:type I restriction enzyme, S subunit [Spiroplasma helicoides]|uniref:Type I restriction enzyme, S subunit n=1 Tax=Spiroplasma helicoides TaxID=216938 RepID=A0A1B3SKC3_9MOLU|nr:restriction endonuclease subunit S [Spiroplasma helicoides]AOG60383.1 type I restriction enzyme, S subunit [Spiroplasma helicoides]